MIVPNKKLISWAVITVLPFSILYVVSSTGAAASGIILLTFLIIALYDAVAGYGSLDTVIVEIPDTSRLTKDREGKIEITIKYPKQNSKRLRIGLALPPELYSPSEDLVTLLSEDSEWSKVYWSCVSGKRGRYFLEKCYLEGNSPLGLWDIRTVRTVNAEVRVYPNLMRDRKDLAALFLNRGLFGMHSMRQIGKGREFEKLRDYIPGDSYEEIHWKTTAKRGHPVTKEYQIERTQEVYVIIDASRLNGRVVPGEPETADSQTASLTGITSNILERYITAALIMGMVAEKQNDHFGVLAFSDKVISFIRAKSGKSHQTVCRDVLYTLQPQIVTPDYDEICTFIRLNLRRRALLIFLTSLDDPVLAESFVNNMDMIRNHHLVLVNMFQPRHAFPLFSDQNVAFVDDIYQKLSGHIQWRKLRELQIVFQRKGIKFSLLENEKMCTQMVSQYLNVKRRQLL